MILQENQNQVIAGTMNWLLEFMNDIPIWEEIPAADIYTKLCEEFPEIMKKVLKEREDAKNG